MSVTPMGKANTTSSETTSGAKSTLGNSAIDGHTHDGLRPPWIQPAKLEYKGLAVSLLSFEQG
jgi:hypothetical protein